MMFQFGRRPGYKTQPLVRRLWSGGVDHPIFHFSSMDSGTTRRGATAGRKAIELEPSGLFVVALE